MNEGRRSAHAVGRASRASGDTVGSAPYYLTTRVPKSERTNDALVLQEVTSTDGTAQGPHSPER